MTNNYVFTTIGDVIKKIEIDSGGIIDTLVIPEGFTKIEADAAIYVNIRKLHLPSSLKEIEDNAFSGSGIYKINIEENSKLELIEGYTFLGCKNLTEFPCELLGTKVPSFLLHPSMLNKHKCLLSLT